MPSRLDTTVLSLDINNIKKMDTNTENLFGMWTIFSKCAESLEHGRRLENLSWRLWTKETICSSVPEIDMIQTHHTTPVDILAKQEKTEEVPDLSASVDSVASELDRRSSISRKDSNDKLRSKDKHITSSHLAQLMINLKHDDIQEAEHELHVRRSSPQIVERANKVRVSSQPSEDDSSIDSSASETSAASYTSSHSIVRGFDPKVPSNSYRSSANLIAETQGHESATTHNINVTKKKTPMFTIGSSPSDDEGHDSYGSQYGSALTSGLKRTESSGASKRAAFDDQVITRTVYDDDEISDDDNISESAIEEDDEGWESDSEGLESKTASYNEDSMFTRIEEPRPTLTSRRSLLSTLLHQPDRAAALANAGTRSLPAMRSRTSTPMGPSMPPSPSQDSPIASGTQAQPLPIVTTISNTHPPALSPRTTRRNMLSTELTESLRKHMLWERSHKNVAATAALRRRHTTQDLTNLNTPEAQATRNNSYGHNYDQGLQEYYYTGW